MHLEKLNPAIDKKYLILLAGIVWGGVGLMLISFAVSWLNNYDSNKALIFYLAGFLAAIPIHFFGFSKLANKNITRLMQFNEKKCLFSFITWRSYLIIIVMVTLGITLRHSPIPKQYLSVLYIGIGLGLLLSGVRYIRESLMLMYLKEPPGQ